ncbi:MAG: LytTR family transcriptional regulator [Bacteroidales bacterium]|jgi:DNA-binding LytR/AlgR family response regulator|nr:LytTR family transcriptional regulator [Bacteroidales bacterium]
MKTDEKQSCLDNFFFIKSERKFERINIKDVIYIEGLKDYSKVHTIQKIYVTAINIKSFYERLDKNVFIRINKSFIINFDYINFIEKNFVSINNELLPIGNIYKQNLMDYVNSKLIKR